ncbi:adenosylcobinamide-phosphate synthase CbiB [Meiothermus rufus]|uniref:adenosylcobinamide-phosphate synthase CbiB n=1 Tax=Meiothermus rufus TaxID=604332 RepID=UPI0004080DCF|nr:adenosylcobinamide-phosphate synthase CbiB [Meiothermus rufus]
MTIWLALLLDWRLGEPPPPLHPVVWMGRYLAWADGQRRPGWEKGQGAFWLLVGGLLVGGLAWTASWLLAHLPAYLELPLLAILLKPSFAFRLLLREVQKVEEALGQSLEAARCQLARLVSRPTCCLGPNEVRESALESLAENLSDSLVAPLFWFVLLGLPGAYVYRYLNTADAMWGYRTPRYQAWGWAAARLDDLANWLPARLTGLALLGSLCWAALAREARRTPSPNGGWPMGALALYLGVRLGKPGVYLLNPQAPPPSPVAFTQGLARCRRVGWVLALTLGLLELL